MLSKLNPLRIYQRSIAAKVFVVTAGCVVATILSISWLSGKRLISFLGQEAESNASASLTSAANSASGILDYWSALASAAAHNAVAFSDEDSVRFLQNFVASNSEILAMATAKGDDVRVVMSPADQSARLAPYTWDQVQAFVGAFYKKWNEELAASGERRSKVEIADLSEATGLPLLGLAVKFQPQGETQALRLFLTVWNGRLLLALPEAGGARSYLVDANGKVILAKSKDLLGKDAPLEDRPATDLTRVAGSQVAVRSYQGSGGMRLGGMARLERWGLSLVSVSEIESTRRAIQDILLKSAAWTWLVSLVFLFVAYLGAKTVTRRMVAVTESTKRIARGDFAATPALSSKDEVGELAEAVTDMSTQIQSLLAFQVENARKEKELETARIVQSTMFPKFLNPGAHLSIAGECTPASECGGDWWSHFRAPNGEDYVIIADATGHGAGAAMVTAMAFATCQSIFTSLESGAVKSASPSEILSLMNATLWRAGLGETTMTAFVCIVAPDRTSLRYSSAGHPFPLLLPLDEKDSRLESAIQRRRHLTLKAASNGILGMAEALELTEKSQELRRGDRIFLYTDGLTEEVNRAGEALGIARFRRAISVAQGEVKETKDKVLDFAAEYRETVPLNDDLTIVVLHVEQAAELRQAS